MRGLRTIALIPSLVTLGVVVVAAATVATGCAGGGTAQPSVGASTAAEHTTAGPAAIPSTPSETERGMFVMPEGQSSAELVWESGDVTTVHLPYSGHVSDILLDSRGRILCIQSTGERQALCIVQEGSANRIVPITESKRGIRLVEDGGDVWLWTEDGYSLPVLRGDTPVDRAQQEEEGVRGWIVFAHPASG